MGKRVLACALMLLLALSAAACGGKSTSTDGAVMPASSKHFEDQDYQEVVGALEKAGFTNVTAESLEDLITGWLHKEGSVKNVKVDGATSFASGDSYPKNIPIIVSYHSFPPTKGKKETPSPEPSTAAPTESHAAQDASTLAERARARFLSAFGVGSEIDLLNLDGYDKSIPSYAITQWEVVSGDWVRVYVQEPVTETEAKSMGKQILGVTCKNSIGSNGDAAVDIAGIVVQGSDGLDVNVFKHDMPLCTM